MLNDLDLMRLHVEAEFTHDAAGHLVAMNEPAQGPAPRFFLGHTNLGIVARYRADVSETCRRALEAVLADYGASLAESGEPLDPTPFEHILAQEAPIQRTSVGLAFRFPSALPAMPATRILHDDADAALLHPLLEPWTPDIQVSPPLVGRVFDGQVIAVCGSVRITPRAHEAGVETALPFRRGGHAAAAVGAWATAVRAMGVEPLYSTTWQNAASRALARSLGLETIGRDLHVT